VTISYKFKIVIADDEDIISNGIKTQLTREFSNISISGVYANGTDVIDHLKNYEVDILISDIKMPETNGIDIAKFIREKNLITKMIFITGHHEFEYAKKLLNYHVHSMITKPIDIDLLLDEVTKLMDEIMKRSDVIVNETKQMLFMRDLKRQNIVSALSETKMRDDFISKYANEDGADTLLNKPCALIHITAEAGKSGLDKTIWQDIGEVQTESIDVYTVRSSANTGLFLFFAENPKKISLEIIVKQYAENLCRDFQSVLAANCNFSFTIYNNISEISPLKDNDLVNAYIKETTTITRIINYIHEQYMDEITLDTIASKFNLSKPHISRLFKKKTGKNFVDYVNILRVDKAKELIKLNKHTIGEISLKVGYTNPRYFGQIFKGITGMTPSQYFMSTRE